MLEPPTPTIWRITLPHGETAVPVARAMVRTAMQDLQVTADRTTAELLTGELVSNALKHTCGTHPIGLVVERAKKGCRIEVHDNDPMLIDDLLDGPAPPSGAPGEAGAALEGFGPESGDAGDAAAADGSGPMRLVKRSAAADGQRAADDRVPGQRAGGAWTGDGDGDDHDDQGRGLLLLRSLSSDAGCRPTACGKAVWFTLPEQPHRRRR